MAIQSFRKKPVVIQAVQFNGSNRRAVLQFIYPELSETALRGAELASLPVIIETLEGDMSVSPGDFVIKGVQGEFYPCKPDIFVATYDLVEGDKTRAEAPLPCRFCDGCGKRANDDDRSPWTAWENLPPGSDLAVQLGLVRPVECDECLGSGVQA